MTTVKLLSVSTCQEVGVMAHRKIKKVDQCPANLWRHPWHSVDNYLSKAYEYQMDQPSTYAKGQFHRSKNEEITTLRTLRVDPVGIHVLIRVLVQYILDRTASHLLDFDQATAATTNPHGR